MIDKELTQLSYLPAGFKFVRYVFIGYTAEEEQNFLRTLEDLP
jgi:hypothetical protein